VKRPSSCTTWTIGCGCRIARVGSLNDQTVGSYALGTSCFHLDLLSEFARGLRVWGWSDIYRHRSIMSGPCLLDAK